MKAITILQPYASLIASGAKWVENRTWQTRYRGPLAIHAGKGTQYLNSGALTHYHTGCVIATADLVACVHINEILRNDASSEVRKRPIPGTSRFWSEVAKHKHTEGPWCWILQDIIPFPEGRYFYINGKQGLWDWNPKEAKP